MTRSRSAAILCAAVAVLAATSVQAQSAQQRSPIVRAHAYSNQSTHIFGLRADGEERATRFADCLVRHDPADAAAFIQAQSGSAAERAAMSRLAPASNACRYHLKFGDGGYSARHFRPLIEDAARRRTVAMR